MRLIFAKMATQIKTSSFKCIILVLFSVFLFGNTFAQTDSLKNNLEFDFGITRGRNINIWPIFKRYRSQEKKELQIAFPIYSKTINYNLQTRHSHFIPFYITDSSAKAIDIRLLSFYYPTLYHYQRLSLPQTDIRSYKFFELAPNISLLGLSRSSKGLYVENNMFFFIWYKKDSISNKTRLIVFPTYWYFADRYDTTHLFFPLYYQKKSDYEKKYNIALLYSYKKTADERRSILFPVFWHKTEFYSTDTIRKNTVFPIYWSVKGKNKNNKVLAPLVYSFKNPYYNTFTFFPLFSHGVAADKKRNYTAITPIFWNIRGYNSKRELLFPILWHSKEFSRDDTINKLTVFPIYWSQSGKYANYNVLFPLLYSFKHNHYKSFTIFPLLSYGKYDNRKSSYLTITPLYWHVVGNDYNRDVFFPVYWRKKEFNSNDTTIKNSLIPLYWSVKNNTKNTKILFPFVYSFNDQYYKSLTVLPLFSTGHAPDNSKKHFDIFPVYWHLETKEQSTSIVFPLWYRNKKYLENDTLTRQTFIPFYWSKQSDKKNNTIYFPFVYSFKNTTRNFLTIFPIYSSGKSLTSNSSYKAITPIYWHFQRNQNKSDIVFPLFWHTKQCYSNDTFYRNTIFPVFWTVRSHEKNNTVLFPILYNINNAYYKLFAVFPLFSFGHAIDSSRKHIAITPLYWHLQSKNGMSNVLLPIWFSNTHYDFNDTIIHKTFFPIYRRVKSKTENNFAVFPIVFKYNNLYKRSLVVFPFFAKGKSVIENNSFIAVTPLFWHYKNDLEIKNVLFPIYWYKMRYEYHDTIIKHTVFPIFWSVKGNSKNNKILFPVVYSLSNSRYKSFTIFPLFSLGHSKTNDEKYSMVTPLIGYFHKPTKSRFFIFPVYNYKKVDDETKSSILFFAYRSVKKPGYSKTSILWPICEKLNYSSYSSFRIAPFVWYAKTDSSLMTSLQPVYYNYKSTSRKIFIFSWFLYKYDNKYGYSVSNSILWKFFTRERFLNNDFETRFLYLVYANINRNGKREKSLLPLYHYVNYANGDKSVSVFLSFYSHFKQYMPEIKEFYEEERIFWFVRLRSNYDKLKLEGKEKYIK
jgi:hypothetical protein